MIIKLRVLKMSYLFYLGVELDTQTLETCLLQTKLERIRGMLDTFLTCSCVTKRKLLSLLGHLAYASKVVVGGRTCVAHLIALSTSL